ncbi:MAG: SPFH domain-containing protein [Proteobacteria bacterium]|jgi:regulator of protease activity HflC (stomatin/prohibitin superfamily)|nr:SPFH domain-containing protein [Pseudomonadota bacterium]
MLLIWVLVAVLVIGFLLPFSVITVKQQTVDVIEVFGKFHNAKHAGLRFKVPSPIGQVVGTMSLAIQEVERSINVKALDNAFLEVPVKVQYRVIPTKIKEAFYELSSPENQIVSYIVNVVRSTASAMLMSDLFQSKSAVEDAVKSTLNEKFITYGYEIVNVLVDDPQPSPEIRTAFDRVVASEREKEAAANYAESYRIKKVGEAQAEAESIHLKSRAYIKSRTEIAKVLKEELHVQDGDILSLIAGIDYRDALRDIAKDGSLIVVPHTFSDAQSSVITAEILKKRKS